MENPKGSKKMVAIQNGFRENSGRGIVYPPDNTGIMTIEFPFSMRLSKLPTFLSMRTITFSSGKEEGKIFLNGVGLSKTKFFVRVPATSAR